MAKRVSDRAPEHWPSCADAWSGAWRPQGVPSCTLSSFANTIESPCSAPTSKRCRLRTEVDKVFAWCAAGVEKKSPKNAHRLALRRAGHGTEAAKSLETCSNSIPRAVTGRVRYVGRPIPARFGRIVRNSARIRPTSCDFDRFRAKFCSDLAGIGLLRRRSGPIIAPVFICSACFDRSSVRQAGEQFSAMSSGHQPLTTGSICSSCCTHSAACRDSVALVCTSCCVWRA